MTSNTRPNATDAPEITPELRQALAEVGPRWLADTAGNVLRMVDLFSDLHRNDGRRQPLEIRDLPYASHPRQQLDLHLPDDDDSGRRRPAVIFVHGGAFTEGHRNRTPEIYGNVSRYFARNGVVGINVGYRLAPESTFPEGTRDMAEAVAWTHANAEQYGIDPARILLMGHSAGGAHVASYAYDERWTPASGLGIAGAIIVSGRVRADNLPENTNARRVEAYYGTDAAAYEQMSGVTHVKADSLPTFVAWSEFENRLIDVYCSELVWRLAVAKRRTPPVYYMAGHNHTSIIAHIDTAEDDLGRALLAFIASI